MSKEFFKPFMLRDGSLQIVDTVNRILNDYRRQGYSLTVRQIYYQMISKDLFPDSWIDIAYNRKKNLPDNTKNTEKSYDKLQGIIGDARMAGYIDWNMIVDRTRDRVSNNHFTSPSQVIDSSSYWYTTDHWRGQSWHIEVMVEKQALEGILIPVCRKLDVGFSSNKGYGSLSALYDIGVNLRRQMDLGKNILVIYFGDHDPSGLDMSRDIEDRLKVFSKYDFYAPNADPLTEEKKFKQALRSKNPKSYRRFRNSQYSPLQFKVERAALNMDQVIELGLPPNPAKTTDTRCAKYIAEFGENSYELDAIEPAPLVSLVENIVLRYRDEKEYKKVLLEEEIERKAIRDFSKKWEEFRATWTPSDTELEFEDSDFDENDEYDDYGGELDDDLDGLDEDEEGEEGA